MITKPINLEGRFAVARRRMIEEQLMMRGIKDRRVLSVMGKVRREAFVNSGMMDQAYEDRALQIGMRQTISQPLIVAMMTEYLQLEGTEKVLEIGTGSGYQVAILAELAKEVYTIERIQELSINARKALHRLHYTNIRFRIGDGTLGWPEKAPFDAIVVTAGSPEVPETLKEQLLDGGRLVIPVGGIDLQKLNVITREGDRFLLKEVTGCRFVKLIGEFGWGHE